MLGFEWLASLTSLVELVGSLIPRRVQIPPTCRGIRFTGMRRTSVLQPGNHWVWPFRSEIKVYDVTSRVVDLAQQDVTSLAGVTYRVDASVIISISVLENDLLRAFVEHQNIEEVAAAECVHVLCTLINESLEDRLQDRREFDRRLTYAIKKRLRRYGIKTHRACVATLAKGLPVLLIGGR